MAWSDRRYRRGRHEAERLLAKPSRNLTDAVQAHDRMVSVDEYEVGFRDVVLEALEDHDTVQAAKFLLRCHLPASSYGRLEFLAATDQVVWKPHPFLDSIVEAFYAEDPSQPIITVDLPARDYHVGEGVLEA